jgi:hypothetical protein
MPRRRDAAQCLGKDGLLRRAASTTTHKTTDLEVLRPLARAVLRERLLGAVERRERHGRAQEVEQRVVVARSVALAPGARRRRLLAVPDGREGDAAR